MIEGAKTVLRPLGEKDLEIVCGWDSDYYVAAVPGPRDDRHLDERRDYEKILRSRTAKVFAIETRDGSLIGEIGLVEISWRKREAELVVRIGDHRYRGKGFGQDAIRCMLEHAFAHTKLDRVYLRVFSENVPAVRCFLKCGFRKQWATTRRLEAGGPARKVILMTVERDDFLRSIRSRAAS
ncbi:MAG: GNAT family N-acetyltransferase [Firmicutes bacterium]|nr:GNAT family N-acetyltransferase [Bacillota bacterium]MDH7496519.1 GNAT family N-acetyltransferase [Bacillota bacterium]